MTPTLHMSTAAESYLSICVARFKGRIAWRGRGGRAVQNHARRGRPAARGKPQSTRAAAERAAHPSFLRISGAT